ncbi:tigger transposable element-derived protein 1-like [Hermetia illucens]|uniref:tigger transposable element-derived protein 1-like n=1 Tax=Hermetia illucens TaxID=343691 RepID=UPI0018CC0AD3|nr:tigger transposable element-derived protein 1-like [Hermetia illucens]
MANMINTNKEIMGIENELAAFVRSTKMRRLLQCPAKDAARPSKKRRRVCSIPTEVKTKPLNLMQIGKFKSRFGLHNLKLTGGAASADYEEAKKFPDMLKSIIAEGGDSPRHVFNVDDRTLLEAFTITYIYFQGRSYNTRVQSLQRQAYTCFGRKCGWRFQTEASTNVPFANSNISKTTLPRWSHNEKAWIASALLTEWFRNEFCPISEEQLIPQGFAISRKCSWTSCNCNQSGENVKVAFLPPNTTSLLQPMDQGVIATLKAYYLRRTFRQLEERLDDIIALDKDRQLSMVECSDS